MASTSFRMAEDVKATLSRQAAEEGLSERALLEQLIMEGIRARRHPGIVFRGSAGQRRAALAGGPDVWEVIGRLQELEGPEDTRVAIVAEESDLHARQIRTAIEYAARHRRSIEDQIQRNRQAIEDGQKAAASRAALLG